MQLSCTYSIGAKSDLHACMAAPACACETKLQPFKISVVHAGFDMQNVYDSVLKLVDRVFN